MGATFGDDDRAIVALQEHRLGSESINAATQSMQGIGWGLVLSPAVSTADPHVIHTDNRGASRFSAGVGIAARGVGIQQPHGSPFDISPKDMPGRITVVWADAADGLLILSVYLLVGTAPDVGGNLSILMALLRFLEHWDAPFVICGDFQTDPDAFAGSLWLTALRVHMFSLPAYEHTYVSGANKSHIDFFLVDSRSCSPGIIAQPQRSLLPPKAAHAPLVLSYPSAPRRYSVRKLKRPRVIPPDVPMGCDREPACPPQQPLAFTSIDDANRAWKEWASAAETELMGRRDLLDPRCSRAGRQAGVRPPDSAPMQSSAHASYLGQHQGLVVD